MLTIIKQEAKQVKYILLLIALFGFFLGLYIFLDFEGNGNYTNLIANFGLDIFAVHLLINIIIAVLSSIIVTFSIISNNLTKQEPKGSNAIPFFGFIFGLLTFGCTGCVVAFFTSVGIAFTPIILPNANLLWKVIALVLVIAGFIYIMYSLNTMKCNIKEKKNG